VKRDENVDFVTEGTGGASPERRMRRRKKIQATVNYGKEKKNLAIELRLRLRKHTNQDGFN